MKYSAFLIMLVTFFYQCNTPSNQVASPSDEAALREFKTVLWTRAYSQQDTVLLNRLLHADFQMIDDNGDKYSKEDELEYVGNYGPSYDEFDYEITQLRIYDNGTALVSGTGTMKGVEGEEAYITTYQSSTTLLKSGGHWQAVHSHVSGVKEERFSLVPEKE